MTERERMKLRSELEQIAQQVTPLSKAFNLVHQLVAPSVVSIHINQQRLELDRRAPASSVVKSKSARVPASSSTPTRTRATSSPMPHVVLQTNRSQEFIRDLAGKPVWQPIVNVQLNDLRTYEATPVGADPATDLAVLRIDEPNLPVVEWADSDDAAVGDWVLALGYPMRVGYSASAGIISAQSVAVPASTVRSAATNPSSRPMRRSTPAIVVARWSIFAGGSSA